MKTTDFLRQHDTCSDGAKWALSISENMADVWDTLIDQGKHEWLLWTAIRPEVFSDTILRKLACRFVRETPLHDGRRVWDLLTDERSRHAVETAEAYADGKATDEELDAARADAYDAGAAADSAAHDAGVAYATYNAAHAAYDAAAAYATYTAAHAAAVAAHAAAAYATYNAAYASYNAAHAAVYAAYDAAYASYDAYNAACAAAVAAQVQMITELGNPFKKEPTND